MPAIEIREEGTISLAGWLQDNRAAAAAQCGRSLWAGKMQKKPASVSRSRFERVVFYFP
jgi:hypothetical protein